MKVPAKLHRIRLPSIKIKAEKLQELAILAGFFMLLRGLWLIYPPLMWVVGGLWLMVSGSKTLQRG